MQEKDNFCLEETAGKGKRFLLGGKR